MAVSLDEVDVRLLHELELDADRANVELARLVNLSPAATLNRVRRLKESERIRRISARLDSAAAGFTLQVYVTITLARQDEAAHKRFQKVVEETGAGHLRRLGDRRDRRAADDRGARRGRAADRALAPEHARRRAAA